MVERTLLWFDLWWQLLAEYKKNAKLFGRLEIFSYFCPQT